ncbi:MAG: response regulator [Acidobacteria bacterium]|nr:response regulator [Acidobacteriota bacterium]
MAETILLVDDEPSLRRLSQRLLVKLKLGYNVLAAENGAAAIASCRECPNTINLLITDVFMPDVGGPELARQLAAIRPQMKVLFVSGSHEAPTAGGLPAGGANFLQKPFTTEEFSKRIREILDS